VVVYEETVEWVVEINDAVVRNKLLSTMHSTAPSTTQPPQAH